MKSASNIPKHLRAFAGVLPAEDSASDGSPRWGTGPAGGSPAATASDSSAWDSLHPHPPVPRAADSAAVARKRAAYLGPNTALQYAASPLHVVRGQGAHLYDAQGREFLDCVNNVAHVGHCHPQVTAAVATQLGMLNTNSRYLHANLVDHAEALAATLPQPLHVMYPTTSGSEANDLALRIARTAQPRATHIAVMEGAYHGHTTATIELSPYKFDGPGGSGRPPHVHVLPCPDPYRGVHLDGRAAARAALAEARAAGGRICAFFAESLLSCGGQVILPAGYLAAVYEEMRAEGVVCVADEVQCGFGRVGSAFWAFETQGVVPDIVTLGKPIGNGFPMGALITTPTLADAFANGMEYFSTCGGCTASGAAGLAVLRVMEEEGLQQHARVVGAQLLAALRAALGGHPCVGDVRGLGLFLGIEFVTDKASKRHFGPLAQWVKAACLRRRVLLTTDGPHENIVKIKPPMVFSAADGNRLVAQLTAVMEEELTPEVLDLLRSQLPAAGPAPAPPAACPAASPAKKAKLG